MTPIRSKKLTKLHYQMANSRKMFDPRLPGTFTEGVVCCGESLFTEKILATSIFSGVLRRCRKGGHSTAMLWLLYI